MNVDFNNLRVQAAYSLDKLTKILNDSILDEKATVYKKDKSGEDISRSGNMILYTDDIQTYMSDLRRLIMGINIVYIQGDGDFKDMSDEIERNGGVESFNDKNNLL